MKGKIGVLLIGILIVSKFWIGIYTHDEFGGRHLFMKHRPIWKTFFYSPIGMSDVQLSALTIEKQKEHILFKEFITDRGLSK
ncbi:hypothetical protein HNV08_05485 [Winogradskyella eckloniae]|uniref:hypothetical protein n=1 Tax=Winogradskyella eckloniae TaxID=1089306 RepID=UPI0015644766|nr:hypothetical protein [Winogradskyella eckloniae]NRD19491.1 hypothetical protein [Winogradskyella eckloniae]